MILHAGDNLKDIKVQLACDKVVLNCKQHDPCHVALNICTSRLVAQLSKTDLKTNEILHVYDRRKIVTCLFFSGEE